MKIYAKDDTKIAYHHAIPSYPLAAEVSIFEIRMSFSSPCYYNNDDSRPNVFFESNYYMKQLTFFIRDGIFKLFPEFLQFLNDGQTSSILEFWMIGKK